MEMAPKTARYSLPASLGSYFFSISMTLSTAGSPGTPELAGAGRIDPFPDIGAGNIEHDRIAQGKADQDFGFVADLAISFRIKAPWVRVG